MGSQLCPPVNVRLLFFLTERGRVSESDALSVYSLSGFSLLTHHPPCPADTHTPVQPPEETQREANKKGSTSYKHCSQHKKLTESWLILYRSSAVKHIFLTVSFKEYKHIDILLLIYL